MRADRQCCWLGWAGPVRSQLVGPAQQHHSNMDAQLAMSARVIVYPIGGCSLAQAMCNNRMFY
jgi:hypothetical protein